MSLLHKYFKTIHTRVENSNERLKCQVVGPKLLNWVNKILFRK